MNRIKSTYSLYFAMLIMLFSCGEPTDSKTDTSEENKSKENQVEEEVYDADPTVFKLLTAEESGIKFANKVDESNEANILDYEYMYNGAGVGVGDINNDGLEDLFFTGNMVSDRLYLNRGNLKFQNISKKAGVQWLILTEMVGWIYMYVEQALSPIQRRKPICFSSIIRI
jgi:hypothetical protein